LLAVHLLHLDHVELLAERLVGVGDERKREVHLGPEVLVRLHAVARDAGDHRTGLAELGIEIAELLAFGRAAGRVVLGVEVEHHRVTGMVLQSKRLAARGGGAEIGHACSCHVSSGQSIHYPSSPARVESCQLRVLSGIATSCACMSVASMSPRNSCPCTRSVPDRPGISARPAMQRGSITVWTLSKRSRIEQSFQPCAFHPTSSCSSTGCKVKTCPVGTGAPVCARICAATFSSVMPSRPISSSSVGKVVGSCGQRMISPFHTGRCGPMPRPSEQ